MTWHPVRTIHWWVGVVLLIVLAGCVTRNAPPVSHFSLLSVEQLGDTQHVGSNEELQVGIGPINVVDSLRRSQIVTRTANNVYTFNEYNKWAAPLEKDIASTLGSAIGYYTGAGIDYVPWLSHFKPTHRVVVHIERFDGQLGQEAVLYARWNVLAADGRTAIASDVFRKRAPVTGDGYGNLVRAESQLLAEMALDISRVVIQ